MKMANYPIDNPPVKKKSFPVWLIIVIIVIIMLCLGVVLLGGGGAFVWIQSNNQSKTETKNAQIANETMLAQLASEQAFEGTQSALSTQAAATAEAAHQATASMEAAYQVTQQYLNSIDGIISETLKTSPTYGPKDGSLLMDDDGNATTSPSTVTIKNFITEVFFTPPYELSKGSWDIGIFFRDGGTNDEFRLAIESDGSWSLINRNGSNSDIIQKGTVNNLNYSKTSSNHILLVAINHEGYFYLNGTLIAKLDLSARMNSGKIAPACDIYSGNSIHGTYVRYENFSIWNPVTD
ncbi:MAG: hypothetical protein ABIG43_03930 [Chloroflexota bacterium]